MKSVAEEIRELRALGVPELVERYAVVFGKAPRVKHREWLWRRIAWKIQEQRLGGLSDLARRHLDDLIAGLDLPIQSERVVRGKVARPARSTALVLGTSVSRVWKNREVRATSVEGGWEHDGIVYRSLSAVARAVTGAHWNGRHFFGLTKRKAPQ